jgi:hypothetical protein
MFPFNLVSVIFSFSFLSHFFRLVPALFRLLVSALVKELVALRLYLVSIHFSSILPVQSHLASLGFGSFQLFSLASHHSFILHG